MLAQGESSLAPATETSAGARTARYHVLAWRIEAQLTQDVQVAVYVTAYHQAIRKCLLPFVLAAHALQSKASTFPRLGVGVVESKCRVGILETGLEEIHAVVGGRAVQEGHDVLFVIFERLGVVFDSGAIVLKRTTQG